MEHRNHSSFLIKKEEITVDYKVETVKKIYIQKYLFLIALASCKELVTPIDEYTPAA
jgi:hypothetical protein